MIRLTRPGWGTSSWSYDRAGRLREERSAAWGHIRYAHDAAGRLTAVTNALGGTTRFDYDQCGRLVSTTDPLGRTTSRTYTASDKVETLTDPLGAVTRAGYDAAGRQTWQTDPAGGRLDFSYDEAGRPTLTVGTDADGEVVLRSRESWSGRTLRAQGPDGADEIDIDRLGRPLAHRRDGRTVSTWAWSAGGELLERTGPGTERTILTRDEDAGTVSLDGTAFGRVTLTRDRAGRLTSMSGPGLRQTWQWDAAGRMILHEAVVDGASTRSEVVYDDAGRPLRVTGPEGTTSYSYDEAGQLVGVEGPRGRETLTWDAAGALRERRRVSETGEEEVERFSYDGAGRLTARVRDGGATTYTYDAAGRRTGQEGPEGRCRYTWSPAGLLMGVSVQGPGRDQERTPESSGGGGESEGGEPVTWRIERDALGLPVRIGGTEVTWDVATAVPSISSFDGASVPGALAVDAVLRPAGWRTARAGGSADPWAIPAAVVGGEDEGRPAVGGPGAGMGADAAGDPAGGPVLTASGTLGVGGLELLGARAYDPGTAAFLTPDPLHPRAHRAVDGQHVLLRGQQPAVILRPAGPQAPERRRVAGLHRRPHRLEPRRPVDLRQQGLHRRRGDAHRRRHPHSLRGRALRPHAYRRRRGRHYPEGHHRAHLLRPGGPLRDAGSRGRWLRRGRPQSPGVGIGQRLFGRCARSRHPSRIHPRRHDPAGDGHHRRGFRRRIRRGYWRLHLHEQSRPPHR